MPVWQQWYQENRDKGIEIISVAIDAQGDDKILPYVQRAKTEFPTVKDEENLLGQIYGFKAVPNGFLIDERGVLQYKKLGRFDIRRNEFLAVVDQWADATGQLLSDATDPDLSPDHAKAHELFRQGTALQKQGQHAEAMALWRQGAELEPDNWIIRKQIWAAEHPDKFYGAEVDFDWQKEQVSRGL